MTRGFTLVETVIVIGVSVLALGALVNLFLAFNAAYGSEQAFIAAAGSNGAIVSALGAAILPADKVLASRDFSGTTYASSATTLVLELPAIDSTGAVVPTTYDHVAFYSDGAAFYRLTEAAAGSARVSGVKQLSATLAATAFTYNDSDFTKVTNVAADMRTRAQYKEQTVESHLSGQWYLRNYRAAL